MLSLRSTTLTVGLAISFLLTSQAAVLARVSINVVNMPLMLSLPLPEGENRILTAVVKGAAANSVWLAVDDGESDSQRIPLTQIDENRYAINLGANEVTELLMEGRSAGQFRIFAECADGQIVRSVAARYTTRGAPTRLDFPFCEAKFTIHQRASKNVPGINGSIRIQLGDITRGYVLVSIFDLNGALLVDSKLMEEGDTLKLALDQNLVLRLDNLVNLIIGSDYGEFSLMTEYRLEALRIAALLRLVEQSEVTFIRNEEYMTGEAFASLLRGKFQLLGPRNATLVEFIDEVATRSTATEQPYRVKLSSGEVVGASDWLREQAATLDIKAE